MRKAFIPLLYMETEYPVKSISKENKIRYNTRIQIAGMAERSNVSDCKSDALTGYLGSNPSPSTLWKQNNPQIYLNPQKR